MPDLQARALRLLARRDHSRAELRQKLGAFADDEAQLERLLDGLQEQNLLSDERYAAARVAQRAARFGNARLQHELRASGVGEEALNEAIAATGGELERCHAVWQKKFGVLPGDAESRARQSRFLQNRGFATDSIRRVLRGGEV